MDKPNPDVEKVKRAIDRGLGLRAETCHDIQSGSSLHIEVQEYSHAKEELVWTFMGFFTSEDFKKIQEHAESIGRPFTMRRIPSKWERRSSWADMVTRPYVRRRQ